MSTTETMQENFNIDEDIVELDPCILACRVLADHRSGVCLIVHTEDRKHNHSTHWFDNLDAAEVINTSLKVTREARLKGYSWSFYVLKAYDEDSGNVMCQDTTKSLNEFLEAASRIQEAF